MSARAQRDDRWPTCSRGDCRYRSWSFLHCYGSRFWFFGPSVEHFSYYRITVYVLRNSAWHWHDRKCSDRQLFEEIKDMNRTEIRSSLVAVKGCDQVSNRFLLYYDNGWSCDFLPNRKTVDPGDSEIGFLKKYISEEFGISKSDLKLTFVTEKDSEKQCVEHDNEFRYYHYRLYSATLNKLPDGWRERSFVAPNGCKCRWLTVEEMLSDPRIREINYDVVSAIRDYI